MQKIIAYIIIFFSIILLFSCKGVLAGHSYPDTQIQTFLVYYTYVGGNRANIIAIKGSDTVFLLYTWRGMGKMKLYIGQKFTAKYNSTNFKIIDGKRYYPSIITINQ